MAVKIEIKILQEAIDQRKKAIRDNDRLADCAAPPVAERLSMSSLILAMEVERLERAVMTLSGQLSVFA